MKLSVTELKQMHEKFHPRQTDPTGASLPIVWIEPSKMGKMKVQGTDQEARMNLKVVLEPSDEGGYTVYAPSLPGCISEGETVEEALANIREAIELYLEPVEDELLILEGIEVRELVL